MQTFVYVYKIELNITTFDLFLKNIFIIVLIIANVACHCSVVCIILGKQCHRIS